MAKLSHILLLYLWLVSPSVNKRNKQLKHGSQSLRGYAQQELTILMIFLLVFAHESTRTSASINRVNNKK